MGEGRRTTVLGGLVVACPLLCVGLPLLAAAGIGAGFALAVGGAVLGSVLVGLGAAVLLSLRSARARSPSIELSRR